MDREGESFIRDGLPIEVVIDILTYLEYAVEAIESDDESRYRVTDLVAEPVATEEIDSDALRELLIARLRESDDTQAES